MQDLSLIETIQQRLTFQQTEINQILKNMRHLSEIFSIPAENANSLRCLHIQEIHTKFKTFFILFADRIRLAYAELQSLAAKIAEHKLSNDSMLKDLVKLTADLKQSVSSVGSLMSYQIVIQNYTQLFDTAQEKVFFDNFSKSLGTEMTPFLSRVARLLTLHFTQLLHALSDEGLRNFAEETALKFRNYVLSNPPNISSLSNQGIIDAILRAKGTKGFIEDGRDIQLNSGKKVNSESLFWVPQKWPLNLVKDLEKSYTNSQNCGSDAFNKQFLADLHQTDDALRQLSISITVLKCNVLRSINEISPKTPAKPRIKQIEAGNNIVLHKTTRDELEDYAREHRCDALNAKGSFREYIQKLHYSHITDLNLIQIDAKNLNLASTNLMKADLSYCDFTGSNFNQATLYQANLSHAILEEVNFQYTVLDQTIFSQTEQQNKHTAVLSNMLKLQKQIHSELSKIKEARGLRKSQDCAVFMKLIEDFFDEAFLLFNSQNLLTAENSHIISSLPEFCQAYLDAGVIVLKRSLTGSLQANQALIRDFIIKSQAKLKQWSELGSLEKCVINLEGVDLVRLNFSGLSFQQVKVTEEQLIKMDGIKMIQHIDPEKLQRAIAQKFEIAKRMLNQSIALVKLYEASIQACEYFNYFACNGKMPNIDAIPEKVLKLCVLLMLRSQEINVLSHRHPLNMINVSGINDADYMNKPLSEIKNDLQIMLAARNYDLSSDLVALVKSSKLSRSYNDIKEYSNKTSGDIEAVCLSDLDTAQAEEITGLLDELKQLRRHYSNEEKIKLTQADQEYVDHILINLHRVSPYNKDTAKERLANAEDILKANPKVMMDLRPYPDLKQELIQNLNAANPQLILSNDQFHFILTKKQQLARSDAFQEAIKSGDITQIKAWLRAGVDVNAKAANGRTPLMVACFCGFVDIAQLLLDNKANTQMTTERNYSVGEGVFLLEDKTPGQHACVELLKEYGVEPNFHCLIAIGDIMAVQKAIIIDRVNVNKSLRGDSPLHFAANYGQMEITALLLANGADPSLPNDKGQLPIQVACWCGHVEIVHLLLSMDDDINLYKDREGHSLLYQAAVKGFMKLANLLIQYGAIVDLDSAILLSRYDDIKAAMDQCDSLMLLHKAIKLGAEKSAIYLIEAGTDILTSCEDKYPLELACEKGQTLVVAALLKKAGPQALLMMQQCKKLPLFIAVQKNHIEIARLLLTAGINPDAIGASQERSCLHQAAKDKNFPMAELLISHGANVGIKDKRGFLPIHWAAEGGDEPMLILLTQGYFEAQTTGKKKVRDLLPKEADPRLFDLLTVRLSPDVPKPKLCPDTGINLEIFEHILNFIFQGCSAIQQKASAQSLLLVSQTWCGFYQKYKTENMDKTILESQDDLEAFNDDLLDVGIAQSLEELDKTGNNSAFNPQ